MNLPFPVKRKLVYDPERVIAIGMDNVHKILDNIRFPGLLNRCVKRWGQLSLKCYGWEYR